jgi:hypothetical protein
MKLYGAISFTATDLWLEISVCIRNKRTPSPVMCIQNSKERILEKICALSGVRFSTLVNKTGNYLDRSSEGREQRRQITSTN